MSVMVRLAFLYAPVFILLNFSFNSLCASEKKQTFYEQAIGNVVQIEEHQSICTPGREWAIERDKPVGTGFFVSRDLGNKSHTFLVTARHVVEMRKDLFIRLPRSPGSSEPIFLTLPRNLWVFHPGPNPKGTLPIDVAVMYVSTRTSAVAFRYCPEDCPIDPKTNKPYENQVDSSPSVTERAIFFGFPLRDVAPASFEPFARTGVVAYTAPNPNLKINGKLLADKTVFYVDAPSFPGNSGGPVMKEYLPLTGQIRLWGLVTGGNMVGRDYTIITPVERIIQTIEYAISKDFPQNRGWTNEPPKLPIKCIPDRN